MLLNASLAPNRAMSNHPGAAPGPLPPPCALPLFAHKVPAGFPSPAEEYAECTLDLNRYLVPDPAATRFVTVPDGALHHRGIREGDLLAVHLGLPPRPGDLVWAEVEGQPLLRELRQHGSRYWLCAYHPDFGPLRPRPGQELRILGVVIAMVRALSPAKSQPAVRCHWA